MPQLRISLNGLFKSALAADGGSTDMPRSRLRRSRASSLGLPGPEGLRRATASPSRTAAPGRRAVPGRPLQEQAAGPPRLHFPPPGSAAPSPVGHRAALLLLVRSGNGTWNQKANTRGGIQGNLQDLLLREGHKESGLGSESWICSELTG